MKKFHEFLLNEEYDETENDPIFEIGDEVLVKGNVGFHDFNNKGVILKKQQGQAYYHRTNYRTGYHLYLDDNVYNGTVYYIDSIKYWVPPYVLTKITENKEEQPKIRWYKKGKLE